MIQILLMIIMLLIVIIQQQKIKRLEEDISNLNRLNDEVKRVLRVSESEYNRLEREKSSKSVNVAWRDWVKKNNL